MDKPKNIQKHKKIGKLSKVSHKNAKLKSDATQIYILHYGEQYSDDLFFS